MKPRTPMHVIGGSLGSGKTTLLKRLLSGEHGRLAVMINEFGELDIDGRTVEGENIELMELAGGCVCCSLAGEFEAGVRELIETVAPEAILVETTGVAEADALIEDIEDDIDTVRLETVTILVDADTATRFPEFGHVERTQVQSADLLLVNKCDLIGSEDADDLDRRLARINPSARRLRSEHANIAPDVILAGGGRTNRSPRGTQSADTDHGVESFHWRPAASMSRRCFEEAVSRWPEAVWRAKGHVTLDGTQYLFNFVAGRFQIEPGEPNGDALIWIGPRVRRHESGIIADLEACLE